MLPDFQHLSGAPWRILPPGEHLATFKEIEQKLAFNAHRKNLFDGLINAAQHLAMAGCQYLFLDGSYVTEKDLPGDFDGCWEVSNVDLSKVDPIFINLRFGRMEQKRQFGGELFPNVIEGSSGKIFREFFKNEKHTDKEKGIIVIDLQSEFSADSAGVK
ncbi:DUF6932 family protein [Acinetobacter baumannii]|uniref:DUF6932 family protein n=1 Tax=Acinetobacter baumannii TaxID=470 RepID=UPI000F739086|nr:hypothetical protein [Acinetobacter baumannii]RSQ72096.1 hypothetical protein EA696_03940 [Acinetobacter baumannii]